MAILNPDHLIEQAERLIASPQSGPTRQVDLRRSISSAYYAVFHAAVAGAADQFVGVMHRASNEYALVSRSVNHATLNMICEEINRPNPSPKYVPFVPSGGFGPDMSLFADIFPQLQQRRHKADYDPLARFRSSDAHSAVDVARTAIQALNAAHASERKLFFFLLLFPPKRL